MGVFLARRMKDAQPIFFLFFFFLLSMWSKKRKEGASPSCRISFGKGSKVVSLALFPVLQLPVDERGLSRSDIDSGLQSRRSSLIEHWTDVAALQPGPQSGLQLIQAESAALKAKHEAWQCCVSDHSQDFPSNCVKDKSCVEPIT